MCVVSSTASGRRAWETVGEIVNYESIYLLCYVRGPEGLIVELAERVGSSSSDMTETATTDGSAAPDGE